MRYGVISDVHGNLHALTAVVADLQGRGVDAWLCVGDLIGYGPQPNECVEMVAELGATSVAGNHELIVLGELPGTSSSQRAHESHRRTRAMLRDDVVAYLRRLPRRAVVDTILLTHGSLDDPEEYVRTPSAAARQLAQLAVEHPEARLLLLGNTHLQQLHAERTGPLSASLRAPVRLDLSQRHLANPGSVGQSRQWELAPRARCVVADLEQSELFFRAIRYDVRACRRELSRHGSPYSSIHATPPLRPALRRRTARAWRRLTSWTG